MFAAISGDHPLVVILAFAVGGLTLGLGIVVGTYMVKVLKRVIENGDNGKDKS